MSHPKPFHIALFIPSLAGGGAERVTLNLARGLIAAGVRTDIVVGQAKGPYLKDVPKDARLINLNATRTITSLWPLSRYLRNDRPDGLISALDHANVVALLAVALSRTKIPVVVATHMHLSSVSRRQAFGKAQLDRWLQRLTYPWALAVVAVSNGVAEDMARRFGWVVSDIRVIYNPVIDGDLLVGAQQTPPHPWFTNADRPVIIAVGRLTEQKDFSTLLDAVALLKDQSAARLIILGEGEDREKLKRLIAELGLQDIVDMPGFAINPFSYMRHASVVAMSSRWPARCISIRQFRSCYLPSPANAVFSAAFPTGHHETAKRRHGCRVA